MANQTPEDFLAHHGILGMHWGQHRAVSAKEKKAKPPRKAYKDMTQAEKDHHDNMKDLKVAGGLAAAAVGLELGKRYLLKHPEVFYRGYNTIHGTKAIGTGYKVVKLVMKESGSYAL